MKAAGRQASLLNPGTGHVPGVPGVLPFDVYGRLPEGVTLLEASAGTGKTFTIAALVARYVAEGTPLEQLLVVTFTRMATGELRDRVRSRLVATYVGLSHAREGHEVTDDLVRVLARGTKLEVAIKNARLATAIADFDAATIDTTHGFCLHVLMGLGVSGDVERDTKLVEDVNDLLEEVVDDLYVRRFWQGSDAPLFSKKVAMSVARAVVDNSSALVVPELRDDMTVPAMRRRLADAVRKELGRRKRISGMLTYDDLLTRLRDALADPERGPAACRRLSSRYRVVLVDEFQDTDPVQWEILDRAFGKSTLVLIGDPKQAIYAFRGADVYAYLNAAESAASHATLSTNWRSDKGLVDAYDALFADAQLGHSGIRYYPVHAPPESVEPRMKGAPHTAPLRVRILGRDKVELTNNGLARSPDAQRFIAGDLASDVAALLSSGAVLTERHDDGTRTDKVISPGHIAVLVRANRHANTVRDALHEAGVPAVVSGGVSVFETDPATEWMRLLSAIEQPTSRPLAATAALTSFVGWSAEHVASATDNDWEELHWRLAGWSAVLRVKGVAALLEQVSATGLPARVLCRPSGERFLTDALHVGRLLHAAAVEENLGPSAIIAWLRRRIAEAHDDRNDEERSLRLESDAEAVQVLTIHRSKGLEFPVVYCPYLWDGYEMKVNVPIPAYHDPDNGDRLTVDVGGATVGFARHTQLELDEQKGEDLRLLYVALTRARHQAVIWWASTTDSGKSSLGRLLFCRDEDGVVPAKGVKAPSEDRVRARFCELSEISGGAIGIEVADGPAFRTWRPVADDPPLLEAALFDRVFDDIWRRTSYSGITADVHDGHDAHDPRVGSEPDEQLVSDEPGTPVQILTVADEGENNLQPGGSQPDARRAKERLGAIALPLSAMPGGVEVGSFIHVVLEETDFAAPDIDAELREAVGSAMARRTIQTGDRDLLVAGLTAAIDTPLGAIVGGMRLRDVTRANRLDEMSFELPLSGGDRPSGAISMLDVAGVFRANLAAGDPLLSYADRLADPVLGRQVRGYLTGSIDLVFRTDGRRLFIVDYKTNRLAPPGVELSAWHYRSEALAAEMHRAHYPLQAILYTVALHRYLRWRVAGYEVERDLGGVLYLFIRGMSSPAFPCDGEQPCGVWSWCPPVPLVVGLSDLFDKGEGA
jgi:exodeoxyribonuclease V beta subunit